MKKAYLSMLLLLVICFTYSCKQIAEESVADMEAEKTAISVWIEDFVKCWKTEDMELLLKIFSHDDDMVIFGIDAETIRFRRCESSRSTKSLHQGPQVRRSGLGIVFGRHFWRGDG